MTSRLQRPGGRLNGRVLMLDLTREQVRGILMEEVENLGDSLTEVVSG